MRDKQHVSEDAAGKAGKEADAAWVALAEGAMSERFPGLCCPLPLHMLFVAPVAVIDHALAEKCVVHVLKVF
jgi:hypothetical protein